MAKINGNDFVITAAATSSGTQETFLHATSGTLDFTDAVIETTSKDSNSFSEFLTGRKNYTISVDGLMDYTLATANTMNTVDLFDMVQAGSTFFWAMSGDLTEGSGKVTYSGSAIATSFNQTGGSDETATYSISLQGTGTITKTVAS